jgi:hypothetical protein
MNIFRFKKQIQKLFIFTATILISFSIFPVLAAEAQIIDPQGPAASCIVYDGNIKNGSLKLSKSVLTSVTDKFDAYFTFDIDSPTLGANCKANGSNDYLLSLYLYPFGAGPFGSCEFTALSYSARKTYPLSFFEPSTPGSNGQYGFRQKITNLSVGFMFPGQTTLGGYCVYGYWHKQNELPDGNILTSDRYIKSAQFLGAVTTNETNDLSSFGPTTDAPNTVVDNATAVSGQSISIAFTKLANGAGLRKKYRVAVTDTAPMIFGGTTGLDAVNIDWGQGSPKLGLNQYIALTQRSNYTFIANQDPQYKYTNVYFTDATKTWTGNQACQSSVIFSETCSGVFSGENGTLGNKGEGDVNARNTPLLTNGPVSLKPVLKPAAWNSQFTGKSSANGAALGTADFLALPIIWAQGGISKGYSAYVIGSAPPKFTVEVFANEADIIKACEAENPDNKTICTASYARYGVGDVIEGTTGSSELDSKSPTQTLYDFILRIISTIIIFLTGLIYKVFAFFVVPVINALLGVRPYQDAFVNIIYPGWLILRNLANIFFIVALLVVGLKILFQQSAATAARGFIMRLIIMALLVNFSLVIGQGIVGIADTVQSQFLPKNSRVIEALGTKLMVEPIQSFRNAVGTNAEGNIEANATVGDIAKPIVLLVLAVAAFFSFLAIAAFLAMRIIALLVLYMISPVAYVGFVMDETKGYANRWWNEFLKYAFITPILVFFLNIAALVATVTSSNTGNVIKIGDGLADDLVAGGLTIISHFIVLGIIYAGMRVAMGSGVAGAKTIVDYAQKGFKNTFKKSAQWAGVGKDYLVDKAATKAGEKGYKGFEKAITAVSKPVDFGKALKKAKLDDPKEAREKREAKRLGDLAGIKQKGTPMNKYRDRAKEQGLNDEDPETIKDMMSKSLKERNGLDTGAAMQELAKNGNFEDIIEVAEKLDPTGKTKYNKNAAGLNKALRDIQKQTGMSDDDTVAMAKHFDDRAKKEKGKSHYVGNVARDKDGKAKLRDLDTTTDPVLDPTVLGGKYTADDHKKWVENNVKQRSKSTFIDDLKQTHLDDMVYQKDIGGGRFEDHFTDTQVRILSKNDSDVLSNPDFINRFQTGPTEKVQKLKQVYATTGRSVLYNQLTKEHGFAEANKRIKLYDNLFNNATPPGGGTPPPGGTGSGGGSGSGGTPPPGSSGPSGGTPPPGGTGGGSSGGGTPPPGGSSGSGGSSGGGTPPPPGSGGSGPGGTPPPGGTGPGSSSGPSGGSGGSGTPPPPRWSPPIYTAEASHYDLLGVHPQADKVEINQAYNKILRNGLHPDKIDQMPDGPDKQEAKARLQRTLDALKTLTSDDLREDYDRKMGFK